MRYTEQSNSETQTIDSGWQSWGKKGMRSYCLNGRVPGLQDEFWRWMVVMVVQLCECKNYYWIEYFNMVKMVNFMLCVCVLSRIQLFVTSKTSRLAPLSMGIFQVRILGWVATTSSRRSSQLRDQTQVSCLARRFFTVWATREAPCGKICVLYHNSKEGDTTSMFSEIIWRTFFPPQGTSNGTVPWNPLFPSPQC